jgi:trimeric autotransporter adhesin
LLAQNGPGTPSFFNAPTTSTSGNAFPLNSTTSNKVQWIYGPGTFTSDGTATGSPVGAGNNITKIFIRMSSTFNASTIYSPNFEISLKQTGTHNKHPDATFVTGMTSVYQSSAFQFTGISANTWYGITLQTPFTYDPSQNLIVEMKSNLASAGGNTIVGIASTGNERIYGGYAATSGTAGTILAYMGLAVTPNGPCTSPPIAGIASASVTNGCSGVPFNLSLSGYSTGSGQTYQWDSSANGTTWFPMPGDTTPSIVQTQVSSCYYRCRVTCSGLTTNSSPTSLIVTPALVSGNFTINSGIATGGNNFQSFTDAISYISCGVNGPVNFTVVPGTGPYVGQISIPAIPGASGTKRITFKGNNETIQFTAPDANNRTAITLNGADFITFDSLNIDVSAGATYGYGIVLMNAADSNIIRNCNINNNTSSTTAANYIGIMINGSNVGTGTSGNNGNGNIIENNVIIGGGYSMYVYGSTSPYNKGNVIRKNLVKDFYSYGIYCYGNDSLTISKNEITRPTRTTATTTYGIYPSSCTNLLVEKNRIHNLWDAISTSTSTTYPIYIASAGLSAANPNKLENNLIYTCSNSGGAIYGIYALSYSYVNYYHNTIVIDNPNSTAGTTYGMYTYGTSGVNLRNNIVHIGRAGTGTKYCIYFSTTAPAICNNNVLYNNSSAGTNGIVYLSSAYTTLSAWQASNANAFDQQSLSLDPLYVSPPTGDFTPSDFSIYTVGVNVGVTTDINDSSRIAYNPGAFRMVAAGCSGTPIPGTVVVASTNVCANTNFSLNLNGNSIGTGLTFTWERSKNGTSAWTAVSTALTSPSFTTQQDTSYYYRCKVQCNSGTPQYSNIVQLVSPLLVNGNFTINSAIATGGNNFQNFADAISYISCGINGPVTFTVTSGSGPYTSQLSIPAITGTSSINRVVFKGNGETISYNAPDATNRTALTLDGADFITIDSFVIDVSASTFAGWGIVLKNQADSNIIRNCTVNTSLTATTSNYAGILINGSNTTTSAAGNNGNGNLIEKNTINGGYYGIFNYGNSAGYNKNNTFRKNKILDFYYYGFYNYYNDSITISKNEFARPTRSSIGGGYVIYNVSNTHLLIEKNSIHNLYDAVSSSTTANYLIYNSCTGFSASEPNRIENNIMYNINSSGGSIYGIYSLGYNYNNYYHNTILLDDQNSTAGTTYAMYAYGTGVNVRNNIINVSRAGTGTKYCMYFSTTAPAICNNNILNMTSTAGTNNLVYLSSAFADLAAWQASNANAFDQQSYSLDPVFINVSTGDLTPTSSLVDNKGAAVGVLQDIRDSIRSTSTPDIGAFEFSTLTAGVNMGAQSLVTPSVSTTGCYSNAETITIKIRNSSTGTHNFATNPVTVNVSVTGTVTVNLSKIVNTGTLQSDSTLNVTMSTPLNMSIAGTYTFNASTTVTGDANPANDAMVPVNRTKVVVNGGSPTSTPPSYCITSGTPTLNAVNAAGYSSLKWQQSTTSGSGYTNIPGATTSPYTVSSAITQSMYYRVIAYCSVDSSISNEVTVALNNPSVVSKTDSSRCGTGVVTLKATGSSGSL